MKKMAVVFLIGNLMYMSAAPAIVSAEPLVSDTSAVTDSSVVSEDSSSEMVDSSSEEPQKNEVDKSEELTNSDENKITSETPSIEDSSEAVKDSSEVVDSEVKPASSVESAVKPESSSDVNTAADVSPKLVDTGVAGTSNWHYSPVDKTLSIGAGTLTGDEFKNIYEETRPNVLEKVIFEGPVNLTGSAEKLFWDLGSKVSEIQNLSYLNTSQVTNMAYMFANMRDLISLDVSQFDTSQVTDMAHMFMNVGKVESLDVSHFNTSKVTNMKEMFYEMRALNQLDVSRFDTSKVTNMNGMFYSGLSSLITQLDVSHFDTSQVTDMELMFKGLGNVSSLDLSNFDTSKVTTMRAMFTTMKSIESLDLSSFDTSNVTSFEMMFYSMNKLTDLDVSSFNTSKATNTATMFAITEALYKLDVSSFDTTNVTTQKGMFSSAAVHELTLGTNFHFLGTESELWEANSGRSNSDYTGLWINLGSGTLLDPKGSALTAESLMQTYDGTTMADTYIWERNKVELNAHDSEIYVGDTWNPVDNFDNAIDKDGNPVDFKDVTVTGTVDTTKAGTYKLTYSYDGVSKAITVIVKARQTAVNAHDSEMYVGDSWTPQDNFDNAVDKDGNPVDFKDVTVTGTVDTTKAGTYKITYSYDGVSKEITVTVKAIQTAVTAHNSEIYVGDKWTPQDNFDNAVDKDGNPVDFKDVKVTGAVDTTKAGTYKIIYSYDGVSIEITVTVKDHGPVHVVAPLINQPYAGDTVITGTLATKGTAADGTETRITYNGTAAWITINGKMYNNVVAYTVDSNQRFSLTLPNSIVLKAGDEIRAFAIPGIIDEPNKFGQVKYDLGQADAKTIQTAVNAHNSEMYVGGKWKSEDNFDNAVDKDGKPIGFKDVKVTGTVDTTKAGTYKITYSYDGATKEIIVTVKTIQTAVNAHNSEMYVGGKWTPQDNFDNAVDKDGNPVDFKDVKVTGTVDTTKAGTYKITYSYDGATKEITVTVKTIQTAVNAHNSEMYVGDKWKSEDNFDNAVDKDGKSIDFKNVTVTGTVDTTKAGTYKITYSYDGATKEITVTVKTIQTAVNAHNSEMYVGDKWKSEDNFDNAVDKDGKSIDFKNVTVTGTVDTTKAGTYKITYSYDGATEEITVTVKTIQTAVNAHNSEMYVGDKWKSEDNFDNAVDKDGKPIGFKDVTVTGTVDTTKAGTYKITYSYDGATKEITVTVKTVAHKIVINAHDLTIYEGDSWINSDDFDNAVDENGNPVEFEKITVTGTVDTTKAGAYKIIYSYHGVSKEITVTVKAKAISKPNPSEPGDTNSSSNNNNSGTNTGSTNENNQSKEEIATFPQTGEQVGLNPLLLGIAFVGIATAFLIKRKNKFSK
ncbi:bacterial Ig-like domain-containing protein [Carnobacterium gallinarum]|uniref:bacterial Ig-like domain-containing protein n=1 Tax=Carnobacterium gallinarum TaxID=2749 RepID=UPI00068FC1BB|nr:bacterial Ig-like domain-containing protein [Carnobacterium gallinarum]